MEMAVKTTQLSTLAGRALSGGNPYDSGRFQLTPLRHIQLTFTKVASAAAYPGTKRETFLYMGHGNVTIAVGGDVFL
jgi:hypothetical protein